LGERAKELVALARGQRYKPEELVHMIRQLG
jgi:hypothetical protein